MSTPEEEGIPPLPPQRPARQYDMPEEGGRGMPQARHQTAQDRQIHPQPVNPMGGDRARYRYQEPQNVVRPSFPGQREDTINSSIRIAEYNIRHIVDRGYVPMRVVGGLVFVSYSSISSIVLGYNETGYVINNEIVKWVIGFMLALMLFGGAIYTAERSPRYYWMVVFVDALITAGFTVIGILPMLEHQAVLPIAFLGMSIYIICILHEISNQWVVPALVVPLLTAVLGMIFLPSEWLPGLAWVVSCFIGYAVGRSGEEMIVGKRRQLIIGTKTF